MGLNCETAVWSSTISTFTVSHFLPLSCRMPVNLVNFIDDCTVSTFHLTRCGWSPTFGLISGLNLMYATLWISREMHGFPCLNSLKSTDFKEICGFRGLNLDFTNIYRFPVDSGMNPLNNTRNLLDLSKEPKGKHLCFKGNLEIHGFPMTPTFTSLSSTGKCNERPLA